MAIKRGVSFYSYQQAQFFGEMDYKDMCRELHDNLDATGVEIIAEATVSNFPFPDKAWVADWHNTLARYELEPVALDGSLDTMRFRDHVINYAEAAEYIKLELQLAHDLGLKHIRSMTGLATEVIERCLPTCEKLGVKLGWEIHAPLPIRPNPNMPDMWCKSPGTKISETVEFIEKVGTDMVGFVPDMGIFTKAPYIDSIYRFIRREEDKDIAAEVEAIFHEVPLSDFEDTVKERLGGRIAPGKLRSLSGKNCADPVDLELIMPYVLSIHGKVHHMVEVPGQPGVYDDPSTMNAEVIEILKKNNWDGYICTEFEGQRTWQDLPKDQLIDEVEQVRMHQSMLKRLIGE